MGPWVFEGKYELDSLAWVLRLSSLYFNATQDTQMCSDANVPLFSLVLFVLVDCTPL